MFADFSYISEVDEDLFFLHITNYLFHQKKKIN